VSFNNNDILKLLESPVDSHKTTDSDQVIKDLISSLDVLDHDYAGLIIMYAGGKGGQPTAEIFPTTLEDARKICEDLPKIKDNAWIRVPSRYDPTATSAVFRKSKDLLLARVIETKESKSLR